MTPRQIGRFDAVMLRWFSVLYLVSVTLAGPALCCCATAPAKSVGRDEDRLESLSRKSPIRSCCQKPPSSKSDERGDESGSRPKCPCKRRGEAPAVVSASLHVELSLLLDPFDTRPPLDHFGAGNRTILHSAGQSGLLESIAFPFLTARDILRSLHILRC